MKRKISFLIVLFFVFLCAEFVLAKSQGSQFTTGFIKDNQGTSFYYDEDNYYNDGWHLIDDNGDGMVEVLQMLI